MQGEQSWYDAAMLASQPAVLNINPNSATPDKGCLYALYYYRALQGQRPATDVAEFQHSTIFSQNVCTL
jgi:hypothetical protein